MAGWLEEHPDQTALELLVEFQARHPGQYGFRRLRTLQKRVRLWRQQAVQRLIGDTGTLAHMSLQIPHAGQRSNILNEAHGNKIM